MIFCVKPNPSLRHVICSWTLVSVVMICHRGRARRIPGRGCARSLKGRGAATVPPLLFKQLRTPVVVKGLLCDGRLLWRRCLALRRRVTIFATVWHGEGGRLLRRLASPTWVTVLTKTRHCRFAAGIAAAVVVASAATKACFLRAEELLHFPVKERGVGDCSVVRLFGCCRCIRVA